jgi:chromosome segregation ATPase
MSQIEELQGRIAAAMARIGASADALAERAARPGGGDGAADTAVLADLETALEEERLANAQLGERVKTLKARHEQDLAALRAELDASGDVDRLKADLDRATAEIAPLKGDLDKATAEIAGLKGDLDKATAEIAALKAGLDKAASENAGLKTGLEQARTQNAGLKSDLEKATGEIAALKAELATAAGSGALEDEIEALKRAAEDQEETLAKLDMEAQRLRLANDRLRETNEALRQANAEGVAEPKLINRAMLAEIEGLRAARAADAAEAGAVLKKLDKLLSNARNLPEGEED